MAIKDVSGTIKRVTKLNEKEFPGKEGKMFTVYSIGLQMDDGTWYNIKGTKKDLVWAVLHCGKLKRNYQSEDMVKMYIESEDPEEKYWKVTAMSLVTPTDLVPEERIIDVDEIGEDDGEYEPLSPETKEALKGVDIKSKPTPIPVPKDMKRVEGFKSNEADKYELGMAKNIAGNILANFIGNLDHESPKYKQTVVDLPILWATQTKRIYEEGKKLRKELLGY